MKKAFLAALIGLSLGLRAQQTTAEFSTAAYDRIAVSGSYHVILQSGQQGKISAQGEKDDLDNLLIQSDGKTLSIASKKRKNGKGKKITIQVPFESLSGVALSGSGNIVSNSPIKTSDLDVALSGSGLIDLDVSAEHIESAVSGSGRIELKGTSTRSEANLSGSGRIESFGLKSSSVTVNVSGSGECQVNSSSEIVARVSGSGKIEYKGNPAKEDTKVAGSGRISKS